MFNLVPEIMEIYFCKLFDKPLLERKIGTECLLGYQKNSKE